MATTSDKPDGITCARYVRAEGKRCQHYLVGGSCSLPDELMCVEWLKVNGHRQPAPPAEKPDRDLFGNPLPAKPARKPVPQEPGRVAPVEHQPGPPARGLTTEDVESFKALGVAVCVHAEDLGDLWLVPAYTDKPRRELTPEHLATIVRVLEAFPGARVIAFEKLSQDSAQEGSPT